MINEPQITYQDLLKHLRTFIEFSFLEDEKSWSEWISSTTKKLTVNCWEKKRCDETVCPAYNNECGRCWLIAGTLCCDEVLGKFASKYSSCYECDVFQEAVLSNPVKEMQELILILIHSLRMKQYELQDTLDHVKILRGLIPICMKCKMIRDDKGYWNQLEAYISRHSEAQFSHGICPACLKEIKPELQVKPA